MADPTRYPSTGDDTGVEPGRRSITPAPLWVWLVGIVVLGSSLAMIVAMTGVLFMGGMGGGGY